MARPHVVIIGAGFGGLNTASRLRAADVDVTLVDRHNFHTFQPLLYQVATAGLNAADVAYPVRGIFQKQQNVSFRQAAVTGIDWERRQLHLASDDHPVPDLSFDHLVVAAGATTNTFGIPGVEAHGFPLYNLADATRLRNHVLERFEAADADPELIDDGALTFVVVGGGPTGVEVAGALAELFQMVLRRDFRNVDVGKARVVLVEMLPHLLAPFSEPSRRHALQTLVERGVDVRLQTQVDSVERTRVHLVGGEELQAHTLVWAAGVRPNPLVEVLDVPTGKAGRIAVGPDLRIEGRTDAYAIGDIAAIGDPKHGADAVLPQLAPVAIQSGHHAAEQIRRRLDGRPSRPFHYLDKGTMATIGRSRAVAELPLGIRLSGTPAWFAWLGLHLVLLAGFRNRLSVFLNWAWNYLTWDRGPRLILRGDRPCPDDGE
ncbi:MAG: FAD-dependent oxidoreductase [Acidimicrobiales bacterium]|nr:FAD-dependent oxidoreductase [Acidimicrobiales bacterium]